MPFTLVIKFSRDWCLIPFFKAFNELKFEKKDCNLILINNTFDSVLSDGLFSAIAKTSVEYKSIQLIQTNNRAYERGDPDWHKDVPHPFTTWTGYNSFQMQKIIASLINSFAPDSVHIQLEDDTLPHPDAITHLLKIMKENPDCACAVTPVVNRDVFQNTSCMQAYSAIEKIDEFITRRISMDPKLTGVQEIVATSYATIAFRKNPFDYAVDYIEHLSCKIKKSGSDIYFSNYLFYQGHKILLDYDCWNIHMDKNRTYEKKDCAVWDIIWDDTLQKNKVVIVKNGN
ncbi:hypothetical protein ES703_103554 [subsurface metagenome]